MTDIFYDYLEDLKNIATVPDDLFPDFLFTFISNDFGEDYYQKGLVDSPLMKEAKQIRRKYSDFFDYNDALNTYYEYMDLLVEKYGSKSLVKHMAKEGSIDDYVPPKPRLKNSKKNRQLAANGLIPSRKVVETPSKDLMLEIARKTLPDCDGSNVDEKEITKNFKNKKERKVAQRALQRVGGIDRRKTMYRNDGSNVAIDFLVNWINGANNGSTDTTYDSDGRALSELAKEVVDEQYTPEFIREAKTSPNTRVIRNGRVSDANKEEKLEIYTLMYEMGIDVFNTYGKNMTKESVKMIRAAVGGGPLTKKEKKAAKKQAKREKERMANKRQNDTFLENTLLKNRYSYSDDGGSLSFRMSDLIK